MKRIHARTLRIVGSAMLATSAVGLCLEPRARAEHPSSSAATASSATNGDAAVALAAGSSLRFESNRGQFEAGVRFLARGKGFGLYLARDGARLALTRNQAKQQRAEPGSAPAAGQFEQAMLTLRVVGGRSVEPIGESELVGKSNYFVGSDRSRWQTGVENYARVRYENVLPGVSLVYYGNAGRELEYDFVLAPGAEPSGIWLGFEGSRPFSISVLQTPAARPFWQSVALAVPQ